jgi:hypothetical protein
MGIRFYEIQRPVAFRDRVLGSKKPLPFPKKDLRILSLKATGRCIS